MDIIRKYILKDLSLKILSFLLAAMLWFAISYIGESKMSISVQVSTDNLSKNYIVKKMDTEDVFVTINGPVLILKNLRARDIKVSVDLSNVNEGRHIFNLKRSDIRVPKGINVENIKPDYVAIEVERALEKRLRSIVRLDKKWIGTYRIKSWYPHYINVEGSRGSLENKDSIETLLVDGQFKNEEEELDVSLDTKDMLVKRLKPETIRVILKKY
jgi:YbbR domain-containing protein